jgi:hypothetical protein
MDTSAITGLLFGLSIDFIVIGGLVLLAVIVMMRSGTGHATALALSFPMAGLLYSAVPSAFLIGPFLEKMDAPGMDAVVYGLLFIVAVTLIYRIVTCYDSLTGGSILGILTGISVTILLITTWLQIPALSDLYQLTPPLPTIFAVQFRLYWTIVALGILSYVRS